MSITEVENRMKGEVSRGKKKLEGLVLELEAQIDTLNKNFALAQKENKSLIIRIKVDGYVIQ